MIQAACELYCLTEPQLVQAALLSKCTGPLRVLIDDALWGAVIAFSKGKVPDVRALDVTADLWAALRRSFQWATVANSTEENLVKQLKNSKVQNRQRTETLRLTIAAHNWSCTTGRAFGQPLGVTFKLFASHWVTTKNTSRSTMAMARTWLRWKVRFVLLSAACVLTSMS